jgi:hypothetical protein
MEHVRGRFAGADVLGEEGEVEVLAGIGLVDVRVAVGQRSRGGSDRPETAYLQGIAVELDALALAGRRRKPPPRPPADSSLS